MIQLGSAYGEIRIGTGGAEENVANLAQSMRNVGQKMSLAITAPLMAVAGAGLAAASGFEQSMNQVQVVSGATAAQMVAMQEVALALGRDTSFSAGEAAGGLLELAKAGLTAEESMAAIPGVLDLAAAGGLGVAQAAEIASNALNAFKLPASDAGRVADLLAAAANASSIEVTDMAMSFQMASAVFASNGQSIEDLSTAIALLGNNGLKASDAGTSLKSMLIRLTAPTDSAAAVMADLGLQVYNADGSMRSFETIVKDLGIATAGLTDQQRNQALTTIFGSDAIRAANILIGEGADSWDAMKESVQEAGAAQKVADAKMRGLAGAVAYAKGTIESTLISAFLPMTDALSGLIRTGADLVAKFVELPEPVRNAALAFAAVMAAAGPLLIALPMIAGVVGALLSPIGAVVVAVAALAAAWAGNWGGIREKTAAAWGMIQPMLGSLQSWVAERIPAGLALLQGLFQQVWGAVPSAMSGAQDAWVAAQAVWAALVEFFTPSIERIRTSFEGMVSQFGEMGPQVAALWAAASPVLQALATAIGVTLAVALDLFLNTLSAVMDQAATVVGAAVNIVTALLTLLTDAFSAGVALVKALIDGDWAGAWQAAQDLFGAFYTYYETVLTNMLAIGTSILTAIKDIVINTLTDLGVDVGPVLDTITALWEGATALWQGAIGGVTGAINAIATAIGSAQDAISRFKNWLSNITIPNPFAGWSMPSIPGFATGTLYAPGGLALVGERGPELIELPRGARVHNATDTQRMGGATTINNTYYVSSDLDVESVAYRVGQVFHRRGR